MPGDEVRQEVLSTHALDHLLARRGRHRQHHRVDRVRVDHVGGVAEVRAGGVRRRLPRIGEAVPHEVRGAGDHHAVLGHADRRIVRGGLDHHARADLGHRPLGHLADLVDHRGRELAVHGGNEHGLLLRNELQEHRRIIDVRGDVDAGGALGEATGALDLAHHLPHHLRQLRGRLDLGLVGERRQQLVVVRDDGLGVEMNDDVGVGHRELQRLIRGGGLGVRLNTETREAEQQRDELDKSHRTSLPVGGFAPRPSIRLTTCCAQRAQP